MDIKKNIEEFKNFLIDKDCILVAISKTKSNEEILEAYDSGLRDFGENKVQELIRKHDSLPGDIRWHMVGHLQRNKVKLIASFVHLIHSIDSPNLLTEIEKQGRIANRRISCLLEVHIAEEESKFGFNEDEVIGLINSDLVRRMDYVKISGLMGMATYTEDENKVRKEFRKLSNLFEKIKSFSLPENITMQYLSMGMTGDYQIAVEEGSNMIRIGTAIFGERNYNE